MTNEELFKAIDRLKATMVAVATGGPMIENVQHEYSQTHDFITAELRRRGINFDLEYRDLWLWFSRWKEPDLSTYASRRKFVAEMITPLIRQIQMGYVKGIEPTGWDRVDRAITEVQTRLTTANTEEQFQAIGLVCRETLISLAQAVFDPAKHPTTDGITASRTDGKRMLEAFIAANTTASSNEYVRKHARASLDLAVNLQHKRTASFIDAALCVEASSSVVNLIAILAGRRNRDA